mgnify:CR=1 FL=1
MNLLHYLPYLLAFMVITAVVYAWGLYRAQTGTIRRCWSPRVRPASGGRCGKTAP